MKPKFARHLALPGSDRPEPLANKIGVPATNDLITITVKIRSGSPLPDLLDPDVYKDFAPLSHAKFLSKFGFIDRDVKVVTAFASHYGFSIVKTEPSKRTMELRGTVGQMEQAFKVSLNTYEDHAGCVFRARTGDIKLPEELNGIVTAVFGLDDRAAATPKFKIKTGNAAGNILPHATSSGYYPTQIADLYNFPAGVTGKGEVIAIIELGGGFKQDDLTTYFKTLKLSSPQVIAASVDGGHNMPGDANGADGEVMLDIEVAGGIAPGSTIVVYFANNTSKGFVDAINQAIHSTTHKPAVISISWGSAEGSAGGWTSSGMNTFNEAFQAAATLGITVCAAAGDNGSDDNVSDGNVHVDFPGSSPYVLACGGTLLQSSNGKINSEVVWHESDGGSTGGGVSAVFPVPSYQANSAVGNSASTGKPGRGVPDIAADADPNSGYLIRVDGKNMQIGGTSAVAPMMAGLIALINEKTGKPAGFIHPKIYATPDICRDITQGNNITTTTQKGYSARPGWDACTGNGVPDGGKLLKALQ